MFYVKARTSKKKYEFAEQTEAIVFAKERSTKRSVYTVYGTQGAIATFANKQEIPGRVTMSYREDRHRLYKIERDVYVDRKYFRNITPPYTIAEVPFFSVEIASVGEDAVRILWRNIKLVLTTSYKIVQRYIKTSVTIHRDGRIFFNFNGKIRCGQHLLNFLNGIINKDEYDIIYEMLCDLRPDIRFLLSQCRADYPNDICHLYGCFAYPNAMYVIDTFRKTAYLRRLNGNVLNCYGWQYSHVLFNEDKYIEYVAHKLHIPCTPKLKKIYLDCFSNIDVVKNICNSGITDPNFIIRLFNYGDEAYHPDTQKFIRSFIAARGIRHVVKLLSATTNKRREIQDSAFMAKRVSGEVLKYIFDHAKTVHEIHNTLIDQTRNGCITNVYYTHSNREVQKYAHSYGDISFELPESRKDLALIGATMGICVGSYYPLVENKECVIIKVREKQDYIACIEVQNNKMVQLKAKYNNMLSAEYKPFIDLWLHDSNIIPDTLDYKRIGEPRLYDQGFDGMNPERIIDHHEYQLRIIKDDKDKTGDYNKTWLKMDPPPPLCPWGLEGLPF